LFNSLFVFALRPFLSRAPQETSKNRRAVQLNGAVAHLVFALKLNFLHLNSNWYRLEAHEREKPKQKATCLTRKKKANK
jgi:hypothetical protein